MQSDLQLDSCHSACGGRFHGAAARGCAPSVQMRTHKPALEQHTGNWVSKEQNTALNVF